MKNISTCCALLTVLKKNSFPKFSAFFWIFLAFILFLGPTTTSFFKVDSQLFLFVTLKLFQFFFSFVQAKKNVKSKTSDVDGRTDHLNTGVAVQFTFVLQLNSLYLKTSDIYVCKEEALMGTSM